LTRIGSHWNNIGVVLSPDDSPTYLTIDDISAPSLVADWNKLQTTDKTKVRPGDMIIAVNKQSTTCDHMLLLIKNTGRGQELTFTIDPGPDEWNPALDGRCNSRPTNGTPSAPEPMPVHVKVNTIKRMVYPELKPHFATLNISAASSDEAIRRHYRRLARLWHPDKNPNNAEEAKAKFQAINTAYNAIKLKLHL